MGQAGLLDECQSQDALPHVAGSSELLRLDASTFPSFLTGQRPGRDGGPPAGQRAPAVRNWASQSREVPKVTGHWRVLAGQSVCRPRAVHVLGRAGRPATEAAGSGAHAASPKTQPGPEADVCAGDAWALARSPAVRPLALRPRPCGGVGPLMWPQCVWCLSSSGTGLAGRE